jgi:hypothetical protein
MTQHITFCILVMLLNIKELISAKFKNTTTNITMEDNQLDMELALTYGISYLGLNLRKLLSMVKKSNKKSNDSTFY